MATPHSVLRRRGVLLAVVVGLGVTACGGTASRFRAPRRPSECAGEGGAAVPAPAEFAYRPRVDALRSVLDEAVATAPRDEREGVARLRLAVHDVDFAMDGYATGLDDTGSRTAVWQAQRGLEESLRAVQPGSDTRPVRVKQRRG